MYANCAELNPPLNWQTVNYAWEFGDDFSLSTLSIDALRQAIEIISAIFRTQRNFCSKRQIGQCCAKMN